MILVTLEKHATDAQRSALQTRLSAAGYRLHEGPARLLLCEASQVEVPLPGWLSRTPCVYGVQEVEVPYPLASRALHPDDTRIQLGEWEVNGAAIGVIAGPCAVESAAQISEIAHAVKEAGASALRGGAYKPRTSPYSFQGHGEKALRWLALAREETGLPVVTELLDVEHLPALLEFADVLQIGSRSMQNFALLKRLGATQKPVLLKRGMHNTLEEWLLAAEYILQAGNPHVILCERGIRTFNRSTRNTFDANVIPLAKAHTHLPILADPSHATGDSAYVHAIARCAIAAGADGLLLEVHPDPANAISDGPQSLDPAAFYALVSQLRRLAPALDRTFCPAVSSPPETHTQHTHLSTRP